MKKRGVRISNHIQKGMPAPTLFRYFTVKDKKETDENTCCPSMSLHLTVVLFAKWVALPPGPLLQDHSSVRRKH